MEYTHWKHYQIKANITQQSLYRFIFKVYFLIYFLFKVNLYEFKKLTDLEMFVKRHLSHVSISTCFLLLGFQKLQNTAIN